MSVQLQYSFIRLSKFCVGFIDVLYLFYVGINLRLQIFFIFFSESQIIFELEKFDVFAFNLVSNIVYLVFDSLENISKIFRVKFKLAGVNIAAKRPDHYERADVWLKYEAQRIIKLWACFVSLFV